MLILVNSSNVMLPLSRFYLSFIKVRMLTAISVSDRIPSNFNQTSFCKKLAKVIVTLNRASSIGKQNKEKKTRQTCQYLPVPAVVSIPTKQL